MLKDHIFAELDKLSRLAESKHLYPVTISL